MKLGVNFVVALPGGVFTGGNAFGSSEIPPPPITCPAVRCAKILCAFLKIPSELFCVALGAGFWSVSNVSGVIFPFSAASANNSVAFVVCNVSRAVGPLEMFLKKGLSSDAVCTVLAEKS